MVENRSGRPRQGDEIKRVPLSFRTTPALRDELDAAAARTGRSLAQEVEHRLGESFKAEERAGGAVQSAVVGHIQDVMDRVSREMGVPWHEDRDGWAIVRGGLNYIMDRFQPEAAAAPALPDTPIVAAALAGHGERHAAWTQAQREQTLRVVELHMRREGHGLTSAEEEEEKGLLSAMAPDNREPEPEPDLPPDLLAIWRAIEQRKKVVDRAYNGAVAVLPLPEK